MKLFVFFLFCAFSSFSEEEFIIKSVDYLLAHKDLDDTDVELLIQQLNGYFENPLCVNSASFEELKLFPFFTPTNAMHLIYYRKQKGFIRTPEEFSILPGFNPEMIELIQVFINYYVDYQPFKNKVSSEVITRFKRQFQEKKGFQNGAYIGNSNYHWLRWTAKNVLPNWSVGLNLEKDAGEKFYHAESGLEFQSFYAEYQNKNTLLKKLVLGDYKVSLGQGLTVKNGFNNLKNSFVYGGNSFYQNKLLSHRSAAEFGFLRGIAAEFEKSRWNLLLFSSLLQQDASVSDSLSAVLTLYQTGYHRTFNELRTKNQLQVKDFGSSLSYVQKFWNVSWNQNFTFLNKVLLPEIKYYNTNYLKGKRFYINSLDFNALLKKVHLFGEFGLDKNKQLGLLTGLNHRIANSLDFSLIYRNYSQQFQSFRGQSFQENTQLSNENALFTSIKGSLNGKWNFFIYQDIFSFPASKYQMRSSSFGSEHQVQLDYQSENLSTLYFRFKSLQKQENIDVGDKNYQTQNYYRNSYRVHFSVPLSINWTYQGRLEFLRYDSKTKNSNGVLAFQEIKYKRDNFSISSRISYFNTDDFDSRIYVYENNVLYAYPIQFYQNSGISFYLNSSFIFWQKLTLWLNFHQINYFNTSEIGSGNEEVKGGTKSYLSVQARWKF